MELPRSPNLFPGFFVALYVGASALASPTLAQTASEGLGETIPKGSKPTMSGAKVDSESPAENGPIGIATHPPRRLGGRIAQPDSGSDSNVLPTGQIGKTTELSRIKVVPVPARTLMPERRSVSENSGGVR